MKTIREIEQEVMDCCKEVEGSYCLCERNLGKIEQSIDIIKVIEKDVEFQKKQLTGDFEKDKAINWRLEAWNYLKGKLGAVSKGKVVKGGKDE